MDGLIFAKLVQILAYDVILHQQNIYVQRSSTKYVQRESMSWKIGHGAVGTNGS